jgi:hypothetical protein
MRLRPWCLIAVVAVALGLTGTPAFAQVGQGLSGPHYELNIIGVPRNKTADMTNSNRHTLFVPLETANRVKIYVTGDTDPSTAGTQCGNQFQVLDGNATDGEATLLVPCAIGETLSFDVFAWALGKPGGNAQVDVVCFFDSTVTLDTGTSELCAMELGGFDFEISRATGKPKREDISDVFRASGCIDTDVIPDGCGDTGDVVFNNVWIFNIEALLSYYWDYDNNGLKLFKVRFYETESGVWTVQ